MLIETINRAEQAVEAMISADDRGAAATADSRQDPQAATQAHTPITSTPIKKNWLIS